MSAKQFPLLSVQSKQNLPSTKVRNSTDKQGIFVTSFQQY